MLQQSADFLCMRFPASLLQQSLVLCLHLQARCISNMRTGFRCKACSFQLQEAPKERTQLLNLRQQPTAMQTPTCLKAVGYLSIIALKQPNGSRDIHTSRATSWRLAAPED